MNDPFDEFSKHVAQKRSRRGLLKIIGGGFIVAALSKFGADQVAAGSPKWNQTDPKWNELDPRFNEDCDPKFNHTKPVINGTKPVVNGTVPTATPPSRNNGQPSENFSQKTIFHKGKPVTFNQGSSYRGSRSDQDD